MPTSAVISVVRVDTDFTEQELLFLLKSSVRASSGSHIKDTATVILCLEGHSLPQS